MPKLRVEEADIIKVSQVIDRIATPAAKQELTTAIQNDLQLELKRHNLSIGDSLGVISKVMHSSRKEGARMHAAKIALQLNGVLNKDNESIDKGTTVNFVFQDSNVDLQGVFCPKR